MQFKGAYVALITPFKNGEVDLDAFEKLIERQIAGGIDGIVPCGCTGEAATLSHDEQKMLIERAVNIIDGRVPVVAGTGSNNTKEAVDLTKHAAKVGADGSLLITPYYNKPTPEGQYLHYKTIAEESGIPIMLYNVPGRTGTNILPSTVARLSEVKNIVAIKEASGNINQMSEIASLCDIDILSGDDSMTLPLLSIGGLGVVSVLANILPGKMSEMINLFFYGDLEGAKDIHLSLVKICQAMFIETNPLPVKTALGLMNVIKPEWRLPLCPMQKEGVKKLEAVLNEYELI